MDKGLYVGMTGAIHTLRAQSATAQNLANANTVGYRAECYDSSPAEIGGDGLHSRFQSVMKEHGWDRAGGPMLQTGNPLDIALRDDHWLAVQSPSGEEAYTKAGDLKVDSLGRVLTTAGHPVIGEAGPLTVPPSSTIRIGADGSVSVVAIGQGPEAPALVGRLKVVQALPEALERGADGLMRNVSGEPLPEAAGDVLVPGMLEGSNVSVAETMVNMIDLARQFELQTKVMSVADDNAQAATTLMRMSG